MKILDFIVFILIISLSLTGIIFGIRSSEGDYVIIKTPTGEYNYYLNKNRIIELKGLMGKFVIEINNNKVYVKETLCHEKLCQLRGKISRSGDSIICVPNQIIIKIESLKSKIDAITE